MRLPVTKRVRRYDADFEQRQADLRAFRRLLHSKGLTLAKRPGDDTYELHWLPRSDSSFIYWGCLDDVAEYYESMELGD